MLAIATVFIGSRAVAWALGVRFDGSSLSWFWQYIDSALLKTRLLESLFYFHAQPRLASDLPQPIKTPGPTAA